MTTTRDDYASPEGFIDRCAWEREFGPNGSKSALSTPATEPQGYVEITEEMIIAGRKAADDQYYKWCGFGPREEGQGLDGMHFIVREALKAALAARPDPQPAADTRVVDTYQSRVKPWLDACFGPEIAGDKTERNHRFLEEALELVQSGGCTASEAHQLVDYVYGRPVGEMGQEIGGVMNTLAALCLAYGRDMHEDGETELARVWTKVEKIRAKQAAKPKHSPLPEHARAPSAKIAEAALEQWLEKICIQADLLRGGCGGAQNRIDIVADRLTNAVAALRALAGQGETP